MPDTSVFIDEEWIIRLILDFLNSRKLHKAMRNLEKDSGFVNCGYSDDVLFLRELVLDGEWEAILVFAQPFESIEGFDIRLFRYLVLKQKFMEVLYFKSGIGGGSTGYSIEDLIKCLNQLEQDCPDKTDYSKLCWLLTVNNLSEQPEYRDWNPETARIMCFEDILELLRKVLPTLNSKKTSPDTKRPFTPRKERLVNLIVKGLCFESCVEFCQHRAINGDLGDDSLFLCGDKLLSGPSHETSGNFLSWLKNLSQDAFTTEFEPMALNVELKKVKKLKDALMKKGSARDDAEILSRSLSLSGRPATADLITQSVSAVNRRNEAFVNRPHSATGNISHYNVSQHVSSTPQQKPPTVDGEAHRGEIQPEIVHQDHTESTKSTKDFMQEVRTSQGLANSDDSNLYQIEQEQRQKVIRQLEEREKHQAELRRQLMDLSPIGNTVLSDVEVDLRNQERQDVIVPQESQRNGHFSPNQEAYTIANSLHSQMHVTSEEDAALLPQYLSSQNQQFNQGHQHNFDAQLTEGNPRPVQNNAMNSVPLTKSKAKPPKLNFGKQNVETRGRFQEISAASAVDQTSSSPTARPKSTGHWIALDDGSGVLNTSTPKSCRQKMCSTPPPPASPISSVDGTPASKLLSDEEFLKECVPLNGGHLHEDKENSGQQSEQPLVKRGPKVNGVRRALVQQTSTKQKSLVREEKQEAQIPQQEDPNQQQGLTTNGGKIASPYVDSSKSNQGSIPTEHAGVSIQSQRTARDQSGHVQSERRINGVQGANGGRTFVVEPDQLEAAHPGTVNTPCSMQSSDQFGRQEDQRDFLRSSPAPRFCVVATLEDAQAIRAVSFHPEGELFAVGSNSKSLRVCSSSGLNDWEKTGSDKTVPQPTILFKRNRHHRGSIYCVSWNSSGNLIATGSNDKSIKVLRFDAENCTQAGPELELNIHAGTVRDLTFVSKSSGSPVLVSGGAGDGNIVISDCSSGQTVGELKGHAGHIMSVYAAGDGIIASGSADNTVRLWDLRSQRCIDVVATGDSCVASVCINTPGNLLASGHEDGACMIYDITAGRTLQFFKPHTMDCRSIRFSPDSHFLLSGSYDKSMIVMDMKHNLESTIPPHFTVAEHRDKVIQCRWHPHSVAFVSSSADRTAKLWALECH